MKALLFVIAIAMPFTAVAADCKVADPELQGYYEGGCKNGLAHGYGHARGTAEYQGEFRKGLKHGTGVKTWAWGDRFESVWKEDRRYGYSAMEQRRQAAAAAQTEALQPGTQVCSWGQTGIAYKVLRVGTVETLEGNAMQVRLVRLDGVPQAVSGSNLQPGMLLDSAPGDWTPCS
jgi:hypothetical protein